jgi:CheY-like chemotaxis protein
MPTSRAPADNDNVDGRPIARILIIDDNEAIVRLLHRMLSAAGHTVHDAPSGRAGLAYYRQHPCDVVITDIVMPDMEGLDVIRELRRYDPAARIIAMSGGGLGSVKLYLKLAQELGAQWVLSKPFTRERVLALVAEAIASP